MSKTKNVPGIDTSKDGWWKEFDCSYIIRRMGARTDGSFGGRSKSSYDIARWLLSSTERLVDLNVEVWGGWEDEEPKHYANIEPARFIMNLIDCAEGEAGESNEGLYSDVLLEFSPGSEIDRWTEDALIETRKCFNKTGIVPPGFNALDQNCCLYENIDGMSLLSDKYKDKDQLRSDVLSGLITLDEERVSV